MNNSTPTVERSHSSKVIIVPFHQLYHNSTALGTFPIPILVLIQLLESLSFQKSNTENEEGKRGKYIHFLVLAAGYPHEAQVCF